MDIVLHAAAVFFVLLFLNRRERMTPEEVAEEARQQQIASLEDVAWAVLETNGKISFIPKNRS